MSVQEMAHKGATWSDRLHQEHYRVLLEWARSPAPRRPCVAFLYGPSGVGKTTLAHRVMNDAGLRAVECNASQFRHKSAMSELIEPLLNSTNVSDFFRPEGPRSLGIILDEIDGMSTGERGGLSELVRILKEYKGSNAILCISNEWQEKRFQALIRISLCRQIGPPAMVSCAEWLGCDTATVGPLWTRHQGDLRKLLEAFRTPLPLSSTTTGGAAGPDTILDIRRTVTVEQYVLRLLSGPTGPTGPTGSTQTGLGELENNDMNLAGLHLHETLPSWIRENYDTGAHGWHMYVDCLATITASDRQDYYSFFHQHWSLLPLSFQSKLQAVNQRLFVTETPVRPKGPGQGWKFQYTAVLSRQSWLFNQFKYLCELRDFLGIQDGGLEHALWVASLLSSVERERAVAFLRSLGGPTTGPKTSERLGRWIQTLSVPRVPPCPLPSSTAVTVVPAPAKGVAGKPLLA